MTAWYNDPNSAEYKRMSANGWGRTSQSGFQPPASLMTGGMGTGVRSTAGDALFGQLFQQNAPKPFGMTFQADGSEGPNTPYWQSAGSSNAGTAGIMSSLQPYMGWSGSDLMNKWGEIPQNLRDTLGATPTDFAKKLSYEPDGQGGWKNTFVEKKDFMGDTLLPLVMGGVVAGGLGGFFDPFSTTGAGAASAAGGAMDMGVGTQGWMDYLGTQAGAADAAWGVNQGTSMLDNAANAYDFPVDQNLFPDPYASPPTAGPSTSGNLPDIIRQANSIPGGSSVISRIFNGSATEADWLSAAGKLLATGLGLYGSNQQSGQLNDLAKQYQEYGAPSRARYEASMTKGFDPTSIPGYSGALDTASKSILARLSATGGNPFGNPGGLIDANKQIVAGTALPAVQNYQALNANTGFGASMNGALQLQQQAIGADGNMLNALGYGLNSLTNTQPDYNALLRQIMGGGYKQNEGL